MLVIEPHHTLFRYLTIARNNAFVLSLPAKEGQSTRRIVRGGGRARASSRRGVGAARSGGRRGPDTNASDTFSSHCGRRGAPLLFLSRHRCARKGDRGLNQSFGGRRDPAARDAPVGSRADARDGGVLSSFRPFVLSSFRPFCITLKNYFVNAVFRVFVISPISPPSQHPWTITSDPFGRLAEIESG
jgi:hypothetical protein